MVIFKGKPVFPGIAFGKIHLMEPQQVVIENTTIKDTDKEWKRYLEAKAQADSQLKELFIKTKETVGEDEAMIIDVQRMMLEDADFDEAVEKRIKELFSSAPFAVSKAGKEFSDFFANLDDPYMQARAADINDVSNRISKILLGQSFDLNLTSPSIIVADDLTPSETLQMDKDMIRAFVTRHGSSNSHTAILARVMNIPCIIRANIPLEPSLTGREMVVDGEAGICYLDPDEETIKTMQRRREIDLVRTLELEGMKGLETVTKDGRKVNLFANIGEPSDLQSVLDNDAEGVGLFRSEFLYLGRNSYPTEEELFNAYYKVAVGLKGKQMIIRTFDIGADKQVKYFGLEKEENPALGLRGIRICLERPELFKTQLRAIYRVSAFGNVAMMFPMIASLWEIQKCKELAQEVRVELAEENIPMGKVPIGIMIETPASVMIADVLAKEVEFFSVGTNDLSQYTLAVDRQNSAIEKYYDAKHPAILEMLRMIAASAKKNGIWAGICGELGADPDMTKLFIEMGYDELSVSPVFILEMRKRIREIRLVDEEVIK